MLEESDGLDTGSELFHHVDGGALPFAADDAPEYDLDQLVFRMVAAFRRHSHINNVVTHISGGDWTRVDRALRVILDPRSGESDLSPLALNIVDLMCADRGVTGRIVKPYYRERLAEILGSRVARSLIGCVTSLYLEAQSARRMAAMRANIEAAAPSG